MFFTSIFPAKFCEEYSADLQQLAKDMIHPKRFDGVAYLQIHVAQLHARLVQAFMENPREEKSDDSKAKRAKVADETEDGGDA